MDDSGGKEQAMRETGRSGRGEKYKGMSHCSTVVPGEKEGDKTVGRMRRKNKRCRI